MSAELKSYIYMQLESKVNIQLGWEYSTKIFATPPISLHRTFHDFGLIDLDIDTFTPIVCSRTRRGSSLYLQTPFCKTSTFRSSYFNRIVNLWNLIVKIAPFDTFQSLGSFKLFLYKTYKELLITIFDPELPCTYSLCRTCPCRV